MKTVTVSYSTYEHQLSDITKLLSDNNESYVLGKTDKLQLDILVRLVVDDYVNNNMVDEPTEIYIPGLLTIKLNKLKLNDVVKYVYAYKLK